MSRRVSNRDARPLPCGRGSVGEVKERGTAKGDAAIGGAARGGAVEGGAATGDVAIGHATVIGWAVTRAAEEVRR